MSEASADRYGRVVTGPSRAAARPTLSGPDPTPTEVALDLGLGMVVAAVWLLGVEFGIQRDWRPVDATSWTLTGLCLGVAVAGRRLGGVWLAIGLALLYPLVYDRPLVSYFHLLPILVLGFAGAQHRRHLWAVIIACTAAVAVLFSTLVRHDSEPFEGAWQTNWSGLALAEFATLSVILLGAAIAAQRQVARDLADRNRELEQLRQVEAARAVADERLRISREMHDVVAHHLTAILMRAQAADRVKASQPEEATRTVAWIAEESRDALRAIRSTISSLREPAADDPDGEAGTLTDDLGRIVDRVRQVGLDAHLDPRWPGEPALDHEVGVAVRRVVQEALTNVLKHAAASRAVVTLSPVEDGLGVRITDDGTGGPPRPNRTGGGAGLIGMQERLNGCGGRLRYGPTPTGGWQVALWVPVLDGAR
jgi:signal transduction histidine kinase